MQYCEVCGVLIANAPPGVDATICERCFASRRVIVAPEGGSSDALVPVAPERVQFPCPSCRSLLQLSPVKKRTKIKCPRCSVDFALQPDGRVEAGSSAATPAAARPTGSPATTGSQSALLEDLRPLKDLSNLLDKIPEKKSEALPSVLDSDRYKAYAAESSQGRIELFPPLGSEAEAPRPASAGGPGYDVMPSSTGPLDFAPDAIEQPSGRAPASEPDRKLRAPTARRAREAVKTARLEREERALRAVEAQRHTLAFVERRRRRAVAVAKLWVPVILPLLVALVFLTSTTHESGFACRGPLGHALADLGDLVRRGVDGGVGIFK